MDTYSFQLRGQIDVEELNTLSPHRMTLVPAGPGITCLTIHTDQSGMIGMLQHLHNLGLTIRSIACQPADEPAAQTQTPVP